MGEVFGAFLLVRFFVCSLYSTGLYFHAFFFPRLSSFIIAYFCAYRYYFFYHVFIYFVLLALLYRVLSDFWYSSTRMQVFLLFVWKNRINSHIKSKSVLAYEFYWPIQLRPYVNVNDTRSLLNE